MLTLNGPCSSFILMMRPIWGSSSATRMWQSRVAGSVTLDQRRDVAAVATDVEKQAAEVGGRAQQHEQQRVVSERRHYRVSLLVLEDRRVERPLDRPLAPRLAFRN